MKNLIIAIAFSAIATVANAASTEMIKTASPYSVAETLDRLAEAVAGAGAQVFARVEHAKGAASIGQELAPMAVLIFGRPELGTPAMLEDPLSGVVLPARVLAYEDADGQVWLVYEDPADMFGRFDIAPDAKVITQMTNALAGLTGKAVAE